MMKTRIYELKLFIIGFYGNKFKKGLCKYAERTLM